MPLIITIIQTLLVRIGTAQTSAALLATKRK